jgi:hypothetical protein
MALVAYSDSEGSEDEKPLPKAKVDKPATTAAGTSSASFSVNKANPRKIQVKLQDLPTNGDADGEPAPKRLRLGGNGGAFSGFNSMLPPPKRDADVKAPSKPAARKVFSLKTGAEPGFSRESDAELRQLFQEQQGGDDRVGLEETLPSISKKMTVSRGVASEKLVQGNPFMFKPLSVARNSKRPKRKADTTKSAITPAQRGSSFSEDVNIKSTESETAKPVPPPKKVSLFSMNSESEVSVQQSEELEEDEIIEVLSEPFDQDLPPAPTGFPTTHSQTSQPQSLDSIASDLNLSKADRRQLFGRRGQNNGTAINVVNFNTDQEYAANEELRASGEQVQHNPVRSIAPGKHSLKQLVSAATGQKDALEESFATGRRNKKEAGSKYGW